MRKYNSDTTPTKDTGWGLIFRLNDLWKEIENLAPTGKYEQWNFKLDRIFANLIYREALNIKEGDDKKIISIELSKKDIRVKRFLDTKISRAMSKLKKAKKGEKVDKKLYYEGKNELYDNLMLKEAWLRKFMNELNLYIKEISSNPAGSMWGK